MARHEQRPVDRLIEAGLAQGGGHQVAIHLATALAALESDSAFVTWDKRLRQAAALAGLVTAPAES